jgi:hypothetical protein
MDLGVVLAEGAVPDVAQKIFDLLAAADPGGELGAAGSSRRHAGDQVDALDGELAAGEVLPPAHDLEGLAGFGVVDVGEGRGLQSADLVAVVCAGALVVVEGDRPVQGVAVEPGGFPPGQLVELGVQGGVVALDQGDVVGLLLLDEEAGVVVLGEQGVEGDDLAGQVHRSEQGTRRCSVSSTHIR